MQLFRRTGILVWIIVLLASSYVAGQQARIKKGGAPSAPKNHGLTTGDWERGQRRSSPTMGDTGQSPGMGAGKSPFLMSEELTFNKV